MQGAEAVAAVQITRIELVSHPRGFELGYPKWVNVWATTPHGPCRVSAPTLCDAWRCIKRGPWRGFKF